MAGKQEPIRGSHVTAFIVATANPGTRHCAGICNGHRSMLSVRQGSAKGIVSIDEVGIMVREQGDKERRITDSGPGFNIGRPNHINGN